VCSSLLRTSVGFIHDDSLRSGQLIYSLYQFADLITKVVGQQMSGVQVLYVGPRDVAATFGIVLGGVPQGETMDAVQQEYFADVTLDFLSGNSGGDRVLDLQIDEQINNGGSIQVLGKLLGVSNQPVAAFANGLESSFREGQESYVQRLIFDSLRPNAINKNGGIEFFEGISSVGGTVNVDPDAATRPQVDDGGSSSLLIIAIVSAVGGIALILLACWYCLSRLKSAEEMREVKRYRERMKAERRARRQDGKETLLGKGDDPEDTHNYRGVITSTSDESSDGQNAASSDDDGRQSIVATAFVADDAEFADFPEDRIDKGQRPIPGDSPPLTPREKPQLQSLKALGDDIPGSSEKRDTPRLAKPDMDNAESFEDSESFDEDSQKPNAAFETRTSPTPRGASPAVLSQFMTEQPKLPGKKVSGSHSVQYQPPAALGAASREVKEAEDVPPGTPWSSPRTPQLQSSMTEDDLASSPRKRVALKPTKSMDSNELLTTNSHQKRVPPKPSKSMDSNELPSQARFVPVPAKSKGASPAVLSRFMKAEPKTSASKLSGSRSVQYQPPAALGGTSGSSPRTPQLQSSKTEDDLASSPRNRVALKPTKSMDSNEFLSTKSHQKRIPPKSSKSMDGNDFPSQARFVPVPAKSKGASPAALSRFMKAEPKTSANKLSGSRSVQYQPPADLGRHSKKVKEAEDVPSGSPRKLHPVRGNTKSLDHSDFKRELSQNAPRLGKINEGGRI
jgi:hypothetical protein